jgi:hypothetical protein
MVKKLVLRVYMGKLPKSMELLIRNTYEHGIDYRFEGSQISFILFITPNLILLIFLPILQS